LPFGGPKQRALFALPLLNVKLFRASNWSTTCFSDSLEGEVGDGVVEDSAGEEAQGIGVARLGEEALAGAEDDGEDLRPQFVDEVVLINLSASSPLRAGQRLANQS
jgi:hypothetical protein